jgi:hypothetical protein
MRDSGSALNQEYSSINCFLPQFSREILKNLIILPPVQLRLPHNCGTCRAQAGNTEAGFV